MLHGRAWTYAIAFCFARMALQHFGEHSAEAFLSFHLPRSTCNPSDMPQNAHTEQQQQPATMNQTSSCQQSPSSKLCFRQPCTHTHHQELALAMARSTYMDPTSPLACFMLACLQPKPSAREGHAAAPWFNDSMLLFGGWGQGIRNDLWQLHPTRGGSWRWSTPMVEGRRPVIRWALCILCFSECSSCIDER